MTGGAQAPKVWIGCAKLTPRAAPVDPARRLGVTSMALWVRFAREAGEGFGTLENGAIAPHAGDLFAGATPTGESVALADIRLLAPVRPGAFIGLWNNFHEAAAKQGNA